MKMIGGGKEEDKEDAAIAYCSISSLPLSIFTITPTIKISECTIQIQICVHYIIPCQ